MAATLRMPLSITSTGGLGTLEQGTALEVAQSVALLVQTTPGERRTLPDYGTPTPLGTLTGLRAEDLQVVFDAFEDRADHAAITAGLLTADGSQQVTVSIGDPDDDQLVQTIDEGIRA